MRTLRLLSFLLVLALGATSARITAGDKEDDSKRLQGTWAVVSGEYAGKKDKELTDAKLVFDGEMFTLTTTTKIEKGRYRIDPANKPKQIDLLHIQKDKVLVLGIYALDGDTLKICWHKESNPKVRPSEFATKADSTLELMVLNRDKK